MADANDVSFDWLPNEERPYNSNWDRTLKETSRRTETDTRGWSDLGASGLQSRENGRGAARDEPDWRDLGATKVQSRANGRGDTEEGGPVVTGDDNHNPYGWLALGATKLQPRGARGSGPRNENQAGRFGLGSTMSPESDDESESRHYNSDYARVIRPAGNLNESRTENRPSTRDIRASESRAREARDHSTAAPQQPLDNLRASRRTDDLRASKQTDDLRASRRTGENRGFVSETQIASTRPTENWQSNPLNGSVQADNLRATRKENIRVTNQTHPQHETRQSGLGMSANITAPHSKRSGQNPDPSDSETSDPSVDRNFHWRSDIGESGSNITSSGRGLRRTELLPLRQTVLSTVTERTEDDVIRRTRDDADPARAQANPGWKTMIVEGNYLLDWKNMFNKMKPRWNARESIADSSTCRSWKTYEDDNIDDTSSSSSGSDVTTTSSIIRKRRYCIVAIVVAVAIVMLVGAIVPAIVLSKSSDTSSDVFRQFDLSAKVQSLTYTAAFADITSDEYNSFSSEFCDEIESNAGKGLTNQQFVGCDVTNLSNGSVIVHFSVFVKMSTKQTVLSESEVKVALGLVATQTQQETVSLGRFQINVTTVVVLDAHFVNTQENSIPNKVSYNGTCKSNDRCVTSLARCLSNVCACPPGKYHNATTNACLPIDCGDAPTFINGVTSANSSTFGDLLLITCNNGYETDANNTRGNVTCSQHGAWGKLPSCNPIRCPVYEPGANTTIQEGAIATNTSIGAVIKLSCVEGFMFNGNNEVRCQANKTWSSPTECRPVQCPVFELPSNATSSDSRTNRTFGESILYTCQNGLEMTGNGSTVVCQANNTWSKGSECRPVQCIAFELPSHASTTDSLTNRTFGNSMSYTCENGYEMTGNGSTVVCQSNKTWSKGSECRPVQCPLFELPSNATSSDSLTNRTFGDSISYTCQNGYEMTGNGSTVVCQANKTWSEGSECRPVQCPDLILPLNATSNASLTHRTFGEFISYTCQDGYELTGNMSNVTCQVNKTWSKGSECRPIQCHVFEIPSNATSSDPLTNRTFGNSISYTCRNGYEMTGNGSKVVCQANKTWSKGSECWPVQCPLFDLPLNATSSDSLTNRTFEDFISYTCQNGYEMTGNGSIVVCQANKTWSKGSECRSVQCTVFTLPSNATSNNSRTNRTFGDKISYTCQNGYEMTGNASSVVCQANKTWSNGSECRPVQCPEITLPPYTTHNESLANRTYGAMVTYVCQPGYELSGNISSVVCQVNRTWSNGSTCQPVQCQMFNSPNHSVLGVPFTENSTFTYGANISYTCEEGYEGGGIVSCLANKSWSYAERCVAKKCIAYEPPAHASVSSNMSSNNLTFGETLNITCNPGYLSNNKTMLTVYCGANGTWGPSVSCEPRTCPNFTTPANATIGDKISFGRVYGDTLNVTCNNEFNQVGNNEVKCGDDGMWSPSPSCIQCTELNIANATVRYETSLNATVSCARGFNLTGSETVVCLNDGNWTAIPSCQPFDCETPIDPPYGRVNYTSTLLGSRAFMTCGHGYLLNGSADFECTVDGNWNITGECQPINCGNYSIPNHSTVVVESGTTVNLTVQFNCTEGFTLTNDSSDTIKCSSNGSWTGNVKCVPKFCGMFVKPDNATLLNTNTSNYVVGDTIVIECDLGFKLQGSNNITCLPNSTWTKLPTCTMINCGNFTAPEHGFSNGLNTFWGSNVTIRCKEGYNLVGRNASTCETTGNWSAHGRCEVANCGNFTVPSKCRVNTPYDTTFNSTIIVDGIEGYEVSANSTKEVMCAANGEWSGTVECVRKECSLFSVPANATLLNDTSERYYFGDSVIIKCSQGFLSENSDRVECLANATWTKLPICTLMNCTELIRPQNGLINGSGNLLDSVVMLDCDEGYKLIGSNMSTCQSNGTWSDLGRCELVDCGNYTAPRHCMVIWPYATKFNSSVVVGGMEGYEVSINSSEKVVCAANGEWSGTVECVRKKCPLFDPPANAILQNGSLYLYDDIINVTCQAGYILEGNANVQCQANGNWTQIPTCRTIACNPFTIGNANISFNDDYSNATVECINQYTLVGSSFVECQSNGSWTDRPFCNQTHCSLLPLPDNGVLNSTSSEIGTVVSVNCTIGYGPSGDSIVVCSSDGTWSSNASCTPVDCGKFGDGMKNPKYTLSNGRTTFNSTLDVTCATGLSYAAGSPTSLRCAANGSWEGTPNCTIPGEIAFSESEYVFTIGEEGSMVCSVWQYPDWQVVRIMTGSENAQVPVFKISNETGVVQNSSYQGYARYVLWTDRLDIAVIFSPVNCSDEGTYFGLLTVGDNIGVKFVSTEVRLRANSSKPQIFVPEQILVGREFLVTCSGNVGRHVSDFGRITLETKINGTGNFTSLDGTNDTKCDGYSILTRFIAVEPGTEYVEYRCTIVDPEGVTSYSEVVNRPVNNSFVAFEKSSYTFNIGENANLTCGVANMPEWTELYIARASEEPFASVNKASNVVQIALTHRHISVLNSSSEITQQFARVSLQFSPVMCNDTAGYVRKHSFVCSVKLNSTWQNATTEISFQRLPDKPRLTMSREIIHNKYTRADLPFICEGQLGSPPGMLSIESDFEDEFKTFLTMDSSNNTIGFIFKNETILEPCGTYQKLYFAFHKANSLMNLRRLRCSIKKVSDVNSSNVKLSEEGVIKVIPDTWCRQNLNTPRIIEHPYLCHVGVSCNGDGTVDGVPSGCSENKCFDVTNSLCSECTCTKPGPTTTTTTTIAPDAERIDCKPMGVAEFVGGQMSVACTLINVDTINVLNISKDGTLLHSLPRPTNQSMDSNMNIVITPTTINLTITMTNCSVEGSYTVTINNGTSSAFTTWLLENATTPLMAVQASKWLNQPFTIICSANVGRITGGSYRSKLYIQWGSQFQKENTYGGSNFPICINNECQCNETIEITITANQTWNNTGVRCIALDRNDTVMSASDFETIILSESVVSFTSNTSAIVGHEMVLECRLRDGSYNEQTVAVIKRSSDGLVCEINGALQGNCSMAIAYSVDGSQDNGALVMRLIIANVSCNDSGEYMCSFRHNPEAKAVTALNVQRLPEVPRLTMSREIIHNKFTLNDRLFICEGQLGVPAGKLSIESDFEDEFKTFLDINNRNNSIGFIFNEENSSDNCGNYQKLFFALHKANRSMNLRKFRCSVKPSSTLTDIDVKTSQEGIIQVVPDTWCQNVTSLVTIEHPYLCHVGVACNGNGGIIGVPEGCKESQCYNVTSPTVCWECTCNKGPTTITTTTLAPDAEQMNCNPKSVAAFAGGQVSVSCTLLNVVSINQLNVSKDGEHLYSKFNPVGPVVFPLSEMNLTISETSISLTLAMTCSTEGLYTIRINNGTSATFTTWLLENSTAPTMTMPENVWQNQPFTVTCSGNVGRKTGGSAMSELFVQRGQQFQKDQLLGDNNFPSCNNYCRCTDQINITKTADQTWNNTQLRCIALDGEGNVLSASEFNTITVLQSVVKFVGNYSATIGRELVIECRIEGDASLRIDGAKITRRLDGLVCAVDGQGKGNCSNSNGYSITGSSVGDLSVSLTIANATCRDEGDYYCSSASKPDAIAMTLVPLKGHVGELTLTLPSKVIERIQTPQEELFKCIGDVGYPARELRIELFHNETQTFKTLVEPDHKRKYEIFSTDKCLITANISFVNLVYQLEDNGTIFRCAAYNSSDSTEPEKTSVHKVLEVHRNPCNSTGDYYLYHQTSCTKYYRCFNSIPYELSCPGSLCPSIFEDNAKFVCANVCNECASRG